MDTFARIALHEMSHMSSVGPPITKDPEDEDDDGLIKYVHMADGRWRHTLGPQNAHALVDKNQDEFWNPALADTNADNYAWMSLDSLISRHCLEVIDGDDWATFFTEIRSAIPVDDE